MKDIKLLCMDVDGTLTDGKIYMGADGEIFKAFDIKDGYGIHEMLPQQGIVPVIITGRNSKIVENRACELGIKELYQGVHEKISVLQAVVQKYQCQFAQVAYIGDDILDLECMKLCGIVGCPSDAVEKVKCHSNYVCRRKAGNGAVREFIEWIIQQEEKWE